MRLIRIEHNLSRRQLTVFSVCWLVSLGALGGLVLGRGGPLGTAVALWIAAVALPAIGWPHARGCCGPSTWAWPMRPSPWAWSSPT